MYNVISQHIKVDDRQSLFFSKQTHSQFKEHYKIITGKKCIYMLKEEKRNE